MNLATVSVSGGHAQGDEIAVIPDGYDPDGADGDIEAVDLSTFENVTGSMHNDRLTGDHRANKLIGNDGDDTLIGGDNPGRFVDADNQPMYDSLEGGKGDDHLRGGDGADHVNGGPGADILDGGESGLVEAVDDDPDTDEEDESVVGMPEHIDWAVYKSAEAGVTVDLSTNRGTGGEAMGDRLVNIELVWGSEYADTFIASADEDEIDIIHGDGGSDTVSYEVSEFPVEVNLSTPGHHTTEVATDDPDDGWHASIRDRG